MTMTPKMKFPKGPAINMDDTDFFAMVHAKLDVLLAMATMRFSLQEIEELEKDGHDILGGFVALKQRERISEILLRERVNTCHCTECTRIREEHKDSRCETCGYHGPPSTIECACYDEWAASCSPSNRGPGCAHGGFICPVCGDGEEDLGEMLRDIRAVLEFGPDGGVCQGCDEMKVLHEFETRTCEKCHVEECRETAEMDAAVIARMDRGGDVVKITPVDDNTEVAINVTFVEIDETDEKDGE